MVEVHEAGELGASVDEVWKLVGDFGGFVEAMGLPAELTGEGIGQTRKILLGADPTVERLEALDNDAKMLQYSLLEGPLPVNGYLATMQLSPAGEGRTTLDWSSTFEAGEGITEDAAADVVRGIYRGGIAALQGRFGS